MSPKYYRNVFFKMFNKLAPPTTYVLLYNIDILYGRKYIKMYAINTFATRLKSNNPCCMIKKINKR